jgi:hypothetical protein
MCLMLTYATVLGLFSLHLALQLGQPADRDASSVILQYQDL